MAEEAARTQGQALDELARSLDGALERLVEELLDAARDAQRQTERVADDVQAEDEHVELFDGLADVVPLQVARQLRPAQEHVGALEEAQPEHDVLHLRQTDADALHQQAHQLAGRVTAVDAFLSSSSSSSSSAAAAGRRRRAAAGRARVGEAQVDLERRQVQVVEIVLRRLLRQDQAALVQTWPAKRKKRSIVIGEESKTNQWNSGEQHLEGRKPCRAGRC